MSCRGEGGFVRHDLKLGSDLGPLSLAIVTVFDEHSGANKPVGSLERGSMFGDEDIMRGDKRQSSVLSKEPVELLALLDSVGRAAAAARQPLATN